MRSDVERGPGRGRFVDRRGGRSYPRLARMNRRVAALVLAFVFVAGSSLATAGEVMHSTARSQAAPSASESCPDPGEDGSPCGPACVCLCCPGHANGLAVFSSSPSIGAPPSSESGDSGPGRLSPEGRPSPHLPPSPRLRLSPGETAGTPRVVRGPGPGATTTPATGVRVRQESEGAFHSRSQIPVGAHLPPRARSSRGRPGDPPSRPRRRLPPRRPRRLKDLSLASSS